MFGDPKLFIVRIPAILLALTIHELAHAYIARHLGDHTAEHEGRITMNPFAHLDVLGTIMLLFGPFGWAKPVPVNPMFFKDPQKGMAITAVAGPLSNIALAAVVGLMMRFGIGNISEAFGLFFEILFMINIGLAVFNMLPVYPLDGSRVLMGFLNARQTENYMRSMAIVPQVFLGIILAEWLLNVRILGRILGPIFWPMYDFMRAVFVG